VAAGLWRLAAAAAAGAAAALALAPRAERAPEPAALPAAVAAAPPPVAAAPAAVDPGRIAGLELQLELLGRAVAALASEGGGARAAAPPEAPPAEAPAPDPAEAEERSRALLGSLELRLREEPEDAAFAAFLARELAAGAERGRGAGPAFDSVRCGATLCRARFRLEGPAADAPAVLALTRLVPWDGEGVLYVPAEDPRTALLFVAREGASLAPEAPGP
jgi:hypothetical protein